MVGGRASRDARGLKLAMGITVRRKRGSRVARRAWIETIINDLIGTTATGRASRVD